MSDLKFWKPGPKVTNVDVSGLAGEKLSYFGGDIEFRAVIAGVDHYLGISIVEEDNPSRVLWCSHGPYDPNWRKWYFDPEAKTFRRNRYSARFGIFVDYLRELVESGKPFREDVLADLYEEAGYPLGSGNNSPCPFGV